MGWTSDGLVYGLSQISGLSAVRVRQVPNYPKELKSEMPKKPNIKPLKSGLFGIVKLYVTANQKPKESLSAPNLPKLSKRCRISKID